VWGFYLLLITKYHYIQPVVNKLLTEISSSISSQWIPIPLPIKRQFFLCKSVASRKRGNHSKEVKTSRPSAKTTRRESEEKDKSIILGSTFNVKIFVSPLNHQIKNHML
jgi:hypothetical protein